MKRLVLCLCFIFSYGCQEKMMNTKATNKDAPIVIAHRGASGYLPEHTLEAYKLSIEMGADFIEPDLVLTKDGVFVARHENEISTTTNVSELTQFKDRKTTKVIEGLEYTGWFTEDFTLAELKTLKARERLPDIRPDNTKHDDKYNVVSLEEIIEFARQQSQAHKRQIGLYIELKHPKYFRDINLAMEDRFIEVLSENNLNSDGADLPIYIQCFWPTPLIYMRNKTPHPQVFLMYSEAPDNSVLETLQFAEWDEGYTTAGMQKISTFADGIGPWTGLVFPEGKSKNSEAGSKFIANAHSVGLKVHPWTLRSENIHLPAAYQSSDDGTQGNIAAFARDLFEAGADGVFTDNPDVVVKSRDEFVRQ